MADNVAITAGVGTAIATDDVSSVHYQINKMAIGALNKVSLLQPCSVGGLAGSTVDTTVVGTSAILFGVAVWSTETIAPTGNIHFRDSTSSSTGTTLVGFTLSTGAAGRESQSRHAWFGPQGINCASGIRVVSNTTAALHAKAFYVTQ